MRLQWIGWIAGAALSAAMTFGAQAQTKISVGYTSLSGVAPIFVAKDKGFYDKRNLAVELQAMRGGNVLVPSLVANSLQIATLTTPTLLQAIDGGIDLVGLTSLSVLSQGMTNSGVLGRTGTSIKSAKDFEGKRVAVATIGSISDILFQKWMRLKGADPAKVTFIEVSFPQMPDVIKTSAVDAVVIPDPLMTKILKDGSGYVVSYFFGELPNEPTSMVAAAARTWAKDNPKAARDYQAAIDEACAYIEAHPDEAKQIVGHWLKLSPQLMAATQLERMRGDLENADLAWWIGTMNEQNLLRTKIDPATVIYR